MPGETAKPKQGGVGQGAKIDKSLDRRLRNFAAVEHGQPIDTNGAASEAEEENAAAEQPVPPTQSADQEKSDKQSLSQQAAAIAKDALKNAAIKAAMPYVLGGVLIIGILLAIIIGIANYTKGLDNPSGPRPPDPVVAGQNTDQVGRLLALTGNMPATVEELSKRVNDITADLDTVQKEIDALPDAAKKQEATQKVTAIRQTADLLSKQLTDFSTKNGGDPAKVSAATRTTGNQQKLPRIILNLRDQLQKQISDLRDYLDTCPNPPTLNQYGVAPLPKSSSFRPYQSNGTAPQYQYGNRTLICFLERVGAQWNAAHPNEMMEIGDMSNAEGGTPTNPNGKARHEGHRLGQHADVWVPHLVVADTSGYAYDNNLAIQFAKLLWANGAKVVIFNGPTGNGLVDPTTGKQLTIPAAGHYNHWHITVPLDSNSSK